MPAMKVINQNPSPRKPILAAGRFAISEMLPNVALREGSSTLQRRAQLRNLAHNLANAGSIRLSQKCPLDEFIKVGLIGIT